MIDSLTYLLLLARQNAVRVGCKMSDAAAWRRWPGMSGFRAFEALTPLVRHGELTPMPV
jgi:hypothetical protein